MDIEFEIIIAVKLLAAAILGALLGYEREIHESDAGVRTYAAVCLGAALFTSIAAHIIDDSTAPSRIIANIITGIGFIGAGIIFKNNDDNKARGLTTAATVWAASGIGVAVGLNMYIIAIAGTMLIYGLLAMHHSKWYLRYKKNIRKQKHQETEDDNL